MLSRYALLAARADRQWLGWPGFTFMWSHALAGSGLGAVVGLFCGLVRGQGLADVGAGVGGGIAVGLAWALVLVSYIHLRRKN